MKKKKKKGRVCPVNAARAVNVYQQGFVGSGVHGNPCKQLSPSSLFLPRPSLLSPSSISSRFSPFYCSSAAPRRANLATMAATDNYYDKITAIQQSLHERYFLRFFLFLVFFKYPRWKLRSPVVLCAPGKAAFLPRLRTEDTDD